MRLQLIKSKIRTFLVNFLSETVGSILVFLQPKKAKGLSEKGMTIVLNGNLSITERLMRRAILNKHEKHQNYNTLQELHKNYWVSQGSDYFEAMSSSFKNKFLPNCAFIFELLGERLSEHPETFDKLVEIGTGNGDVLAYLSSEFPDIGHFTGIDLSEAQIKKNQVNFSSNNRLEFVAADGFEWVKNHGKSHTVFVTSRGVLEYFTQERLQAFLKHVKALGKTMFVAIEPNGTGHNLEKNPNSEPYGPERSFSHNYQKLFDEAGFDVWHYSEKPENQSTVMCFVGASSKL